jgi:aryl-alcohol dehydrogenase-like predicted oxidoreductase
MMPMLRDWDFDALITHNRFTLLNRNAEEMIDLAQSRGCAVLNAAPYAERRSGQGFRFATNAMSTRRRLRSS